MPSIIRKLYYHRRFTRLPKVATGTTDSWTRATGISGKGEYNGSCIWSPCGRFVAAQMEGAVDIRSQTTLELITTLHSTETTPDLAGPLAYSPDGRSIACASYTAIIIWDIQTGGVAKEIECSANNISLVWSSDGRTIFTIHSGDQGAFIAHMYDVSSGATLSSGTLLSRDNPHLWTDGEFFFIMTTVHDRYHGRTVDIFKVGSTLTKIRSFTFPLADGAEIRSFSPTAYRISTSDCSTLHILDIQSSECLLDESSQYSSDSFSSDGSHFAAYHPDIVTIWRYDSSRYVLLGSFGREGPPGLPLLFSPTPSSMLCCTKGILWVWRLCQHALGPSIGRGDHVGLSRSWTHIATACNLENTITITDLLGQHPLQFIDTDVEIEGLVITGNVLLVVGSGQLVAWLLTEDGVVDGVIGDRRVDRSDSIWAMSGSNWGPRWGFNVEGRVGFIMLPGNAPHVYDTETGEVHSTEELRDVKDIAYRFRFFYVGREYLRFNNFHQCDTHPGDSWQTSEATLREGWVKDAEGRHRLWVPAEWRTNWDPMDWRHDVTTQFGFLGGRIVVVKF